MLHKVREGEGQARTSKERKDGICEDVTNKCTAACNVSGGVSCSKVLLVDVYSEANPDRVYHVYAIFDDQSNSSLISSALSTCLLAVTRQKKNMGIE